MRTWEEWRRILSPEERGFADQLIFLEEGLTLFQKAKTLQQALFAAGRVARAAIECGGWKSPHWFHLVAIATKWIDPRTPEIVGDIYTWLERHVWRHHER